MTINRDCEAASAVMLQLRHDLTRQIALTAESIGRAEKAESDLAAYEQTSGDPCPACGWRGIRGDGCCAFCAQDHARNPANDEIKALRLACENECRNTADVEAKLAAAEERATSVIRDGLRVSLALAEAAVALAACERERDHYARALVVKDEHVAFASDRDLALSEAERLRDALAAIVARQEKWNDQDDVSGVDCVVDMGEIAEAALSPATPASPSSAAPSSEYRRGYAKAVELLRVADDRLSELIARPSEAHDAGIVIQRQIRAALDALLPAPEREGTEAEVERCAQAAYTCHWSEADGSLGGEPTWCEMVESGDSFWPDAWRRVARAVLAAMGRGK